MLPDDTNRKDNKLDLRRAARFYEDTLGLKIAYRETRIENLKNSIFHIWVLKP